MQNNQIAIDGVTYERFQEYPDRSIYTTNGHTVVRPRLLTLGRVIPTGPDSSIKTRYKHSRVINDAAGRTGTIIIETNISYPQWAVDKDVTEEVTRHNNFGASPEATSLITLQNI